MSVSDAGHVKGGLAAHCLAAPAAVYDFGGLHQCPGVSLITLCRHEGGLGHLAADWLTPVLVPLSCNEQRGVQLPCHASLAVELPRWQ